MNILMKYKTRISHYFGQQGIMIFLFAGLIQCFLAAGTPLFGQEFSSPNWVKRTIYIDPSFSGVGKGTITAPYNNFSSVPQQSKTAYLFKRGTTTLHNKGMDFGVDSIYIGAYGKGEKPILRPKTVYSNLSFTGNYIYIQNLVVYPQYSKSVSIEFVGSAFCWADSITTYKSNEGIKTTDCSIVTLSNCHIYSMVNNGVNCTNSDKLVLSNLNIHDVKYSCIAGDLQKDVTINNCYLDNSVAGSKYALIINSSNSVKVTNTTFIGHPESTIVYIGSSEAGWSFNGCTIENGKWGIWNHGDLDVKNSIFKNLSGYAINGADAKVYNCNFIDIPDGKVFKGWYGNWEIYNSNFYNVKQIFSAKYELVKAFNNNYYNPGSEQPLAPWGVKCLNVDPQFVNYAKNDFRYKSTSTLIDKGLNIKYITRDFAGCKRPAGTSHDIGAYEYYKAGTEVYVDPQTTTPPVTPPPPVVTPPSTNIPNTVPNEVFPTLSWLEDTIYIDPSYKGTGKGTLTSPYNLFSKVPKQTKTAYLFKRGQTIYHDAGITFTEDSIYIGAYGTGKNPILRPNTPHRSVYMLGDHSYIQNVAIHPQDSNSKGLEFAYCNYAWADNVETYNCFRGLNAGACGKVTFSNCNVHDIKHDGMYTAHNDTLILVNTKISNVNLDWRYWPTISISGGDCLQGEGNDIVIVDNCFLDHSSQSGKFALIMNGSDSVIVRNTTLIGHVESSAVYIGSSKRGWSFESSKILGGNIGLWNHGKLVVKNSVFRNLNEYAISGSGGAKLYNCNFIDLTTGKALKGWGSKWEVYNCIFYNVTCVFSATEDLVKASNNNYYNPGSTQPVFQWGEKIYNYNPEFVDYAKGDFKLKSTSQIIDKGLKFNHLTQDINGYKRYNGTTNDIGVSEYYKSGSEVFAESNTKYFSDVKASGNPISSPEKSIDERKDSGVKVYPNPANNFISVTSDDNAGIADRFKIFALDGTLVQEELFNNQSTINVSLNLPEALYFIQVVYENGSSVSETLLIE